MPKVILNGWNEGALKISMTHLQQEMLGLGLKEAKHNVDSVMKGQTIVLVVADKAIADAFAKRAIGFLIAKLYRNKLLQLI